MARTATLVLSARERLLGKLAYNAARERFAVSYDTPDGAVVVTDSREGVPTLVARLIQAGYKVTGCVRVN